MSSPVLLLIDGKAQTTKAFAELIAKRNEILGETAKDATVAAVIDVLVSLRALTRSAYGRKRFPGIRVERRGDLRVSWNNHRRCLRQGDALFSRPGVRVKYFLSGVPENQLKVFEVTPEREDTKPYYVVAANAKVAKDFETAASRHRVAMYGALARHTLGVAMYKASRRNVSDPVGREAKIAASKLAYVTISADGIGRYGISMKSAVDHSVKALKGGRGDIDLAVQRAANKIAGRLNNYLKNQGKLGERVPTPFPEIVRRRK